MEPIDINTITGIIVGLVIIVPLIYLAITSKEGPFHGYYSQNKHDKEQDKEKPA